jgi:PAS domain S-box-containing protein
VVLENKNFRKDGTIVVLETSGVPRFTDDGRFIGYRGIDRDVTDRNRVEEALKESEERLSSILRGTPVLQFVIDSNHKIISWNKALEEYSGIAAAEILGTDQQWRAFYPEKRPVLADLLVDGRIDLIPELYAGKFSKSGLVKGAYDAIDFFPHMGESGIWLHFTAAPVVDAKGTVIGAVETLEDITKRRMAEEALQKSEKKYRHVLENMQDAYFRADRDGNLTMVNPSAVRMYGFGSADEMIGIPAASLYDNPEQREDMLRELKEKGIVTDLTGKGRRKDGSTFWASMNAQFIIDDDGRILGTEGIVRDISERRTMENAIHEVNRKLNLLNSITRHDVANQLIALRGYTQIAMIRKPEPVISDLLTKIDAAAETIASQIEFTKVYQEMGLKDPAWFRIEDVVSKAGYQQVKFSNTCRSNEIFADPMLERIFLNLFDNSIRHGEKVTEITVRCERAPGGLLIIVEDDGVGIPLEEKEKIFEKGFGKHTGFGLFLAKEVLSLTGITIRETGVFQQGSRFEILVPKGLYRIVPQTIRPDQG